VVQTDECSAVLKNALAEMTSGWRVWQRDRPQQQTTDGESNRSIRSSRRCLIVRQMQEQDGYDGGSGAAVVVGVGWGGIGRGRSVLMLTAGRGQPGRRTLTGECPSGESERVAEGAE
jgi:hypothetical protein